MDNDFFKHTLEAVLYAFKRIMVANDNHNYTLIDIITRQEIKAIKEDLNILKGENK